MGIIASNSYLAVFSLGTFIGASSAYFLLRFQNKNQKIWKDGMEERFEVCIFSLLSKPELLDF